MKMSDKEFIKIYVVAAYSDGYIYNVYFKTEEGADSFINDDVKNYNMEGK